MGTKLAPALATIYIGQLEKTFLAGRALKPVLWFRYIDDIFGVWSHSLSEFHTFLIDLNGVQDRIKFTAEVSQQACNFLDLTIYKPPSFKKQQDCSPQESTINPQTLSPSLSTLATFRHTFIKA